MSAEEELQRVVDAARKTEMDGREFYAQTAAKTANPLARRMFESLVAAEQEHLEFIDQLAAGEFKVLPYKGEFARNLATVFSDMGGDVKARTESIEDDIKALDFAIDMEDKSMAFYRRWAEKTSDGKIREFCARLRDEEQDHWRILQSTKDYLDDTGNWFMVQEGWSFDGG